MVPHEGATYKIKCSSSESPGNCKIQLQAGKAYIKTKMIHDLTNDEPCYNSNTRIGPIEACMHSPEMRFVVQVFIVQAYQSQLGGAGTAPGSQWLYTLSGTVCFRSGLRETAWKGESALGRVVKVVVSLEITSKCRGLDFYMWKANENSFLRETLTKERPTRTHYYVDKVKKKQAKEWS